MPRTYETSVSARRPIELGKSGLAARAPSTVITALQRTVSKFGDRPALRYKQSKKEPYQEVTWGQYYADIQQFARAAIAAGFNKREAIAIIGFNAPPFFVSNMAAILAGGIAAGIYTTNSPEACKYIVNHAHATIVVCENEKQLSKFMDIRDQMPQVIAYVVWDTADSSAATFASDIEGAKRKGIYTLKQFMSLGSLDATNGRALQEQLEQRMVEQTPEDVCTLVYTSGTTAMPKAVMISHDNVVHIATCVLEKFSADENERMISYLPLSHIAAALLDMFGPIVMGYSITIAQPDALKGSLVETMKDVRPTIFFGVPRVFEKIMEKMVDIGARAGCCVRGISRIAKKIGTAATLAEERGEPMPWGYTLAKFIVYDRIRSNLGLDQCRYLVSAASPLAPAIAAYFASLNMPIHEAYGMSETTGPVTVDLPGESKSGTCGKTLPGMEVGILRLKEEGVDSWDPTPLPRGEEGEVCMRGRNIMVGYKDDEANSKATIDEYGWLHSGDVGVIDEDGFLRITGRAKELIKTTGGENIPPLLIENAIKEELKIISHAVVIGDHRKFLTVLLGLRTHHDAAGNPTSELDRHAQEILQSANCSAKTIEEAKADPAFAAYVDAGIKRANNKAISNAQRVQKWALLPHDLSVNTGELTPTLKIKRKIVASKFEEIINRMYAGSAAE